MPVGSLKELAAQAVSRLDQAQQQAQQVPQELFGFAQAVRAMQPQLEPDAARFGELSGQVGHVMETAQTEN